MTFSGACALIERLLAGDARRQTVDEAANAATLRESLFRLRDSMRSNAWTDGSRHIALGRIVRDYDAAARADGFHALHDWDGKADTVLEDTIPIDVLHYVARQRGEHPPNAAVLGILVDYYFVHILSLLALRVWDGGDADANLDRLNELVLLLHDSNGSGQRFVDNAETLILIATSHFEIVEIGYARLLARVRTLNRTHQVNIARGHAASMGSHLRFGFQATYGRDTVNMRNDNLADYPWLCYALLTMMREYVRMRGAGIDDAEGNSVVEALLNGLSADPRAFFGDAPASLAGGEADRQDFRALFHDHRDELLPMFDQYRPTERLYSPMSFFFNFSHNVLKGTVVDALLRGHVWDLTFNDLMTALPREEPIAAAKTELATTLMGYARANPDRIRGRLTPVIVYDPAAGREAFSAAMRKLRT